VSTALRRTLVLSLALAVGLPTLPSLLGSADAQAQSRKEEKKREVLDYKAYEREKNREIYGELANEKRQEAITQLKKILKEQTLAPDTRAEMLMRLAELYFEQSKYEYAGEMSVYDKLYEKWFNLPASQQKKTPQPKVETSKSNAYTKRAIENYRNILKNYPNYPRADEALFFLAFMLNDLGEERDALESYNKLVKTYPDSTFIPDAYNSIGEYYFNNNNAYKALQNYKRAAKYTQSKIYTFALYKMGWCYYNVGEYSTAIDTMKELISEQDRRMAAAGENVGISLKEEALRDLVLFFSEEGDLEAAKEYFTRYGEKKYYRKMLARLGNIYMDQGKNELAIQTYRELIADNPNASDNPDNQNQIVKAYWERDLFDEASEEIDKLVETYGRESRWANSNGDDKGALKESERLIEKNLRNVAIDSHQQALKRRSAKLLLLAEEKYQGYLDYFPSGHKSYSMRFWYAEVLYKLKKFDRASDEYEKVVAVDSKGKFLKDAASNAIFAIDEYLKPIKSKLEAKAKKQIRDAKRSGEGTAKFAAVELHAWESRLIKACDSYAKYLPDDDQSQSFLYKAALLLHDRNHFNDSNERFLQIIRKDPKSKMAEHGVYTVLDSYKAIENWEGLNKAAREFFANDELKKSTKFKSALRDDFQRATFKIAEAFAAGEKLPEAAKAFKDFYDEFQDSDVRDLALFNSAFYYGQTKDKATMLTLRHEFVEKFPEPAGKDASKMQLYEKSVSLLGDHYRSIADYAQSARFFRTLYDKDNAFELEGFTGSKDALYNSALFNESMGKTEDAIKDYTDYLGAIDDEAEKLSIRMRMADLLFRSGSQDEAATRWKGLYGDKAVRSLSYDVYMEAFVRYGRTIEDSKKRLAHYAAGMKDFNTVVKTLETESRARFFAAEMRFELLEPEFRKYESLAMPADSKKASAVLKKKTEGIPSLTKSYVEILDLKQGAWGIAALYRIGAVYADYATKLKTAPCPKKLDEDQCSIYEFGLEDRAYPVIDKAVEAFTSARNKSYELGLYTDYTVKVLKELSTLRPEEYPESAEQLPAPDYSSNPYSLADFVQ
jgi:cellulose synthase operon protein C